MSEAGYVCLRDALTIARDDSPPRTVAMLKKRLICAGHSDEAVMEALAAWASRVVTRMNKTEER